MRSSPFLLTFAATATPILANTISSRQEEKTPLNDIDTLCMANFSGDPKTIICMKDGTSTTFSTRVTSYLRNSDDAMCCEADNICMLSGMGVAACYDPKDKRAGIAQDGGVCEMNAAGDACDWTGLKKESPHSHFTTKGVTTVRSVRNGQAVLEGGGSSSGSGNGGGGGSTGAGKSGASGLETSGLWALALVGACALLFA
ncbi:hypothetical protein B0T16DRAFT_490868 [Cercophora newfieldiana]|uniref:Uncharacterized protein n=1 Tax=Cercophora newfieldiana TaxID=92897 RepID=A0AA39YIE1_9PEZI|nr:hypothetical protein B0T16DRAFT_490868 [Cercophora newfieldiana]